MNDGLKTRRIESKFARFRSYAGYKLDSTAGPRRSSEVTNYCRLQWYDQLLRNPMTAPAEGQAFTRQLHQAVLAGPEGLGELVGLARVKMDGNERGPLTILPVNSPEEALETVKRSLTDCQVAFQAATATLKPSELKELAKNLLPIFVTQNQNGHTLSQRSTGRRLCGLMEKIDRNALYSAADALVPLSDPELLRELASIDEEPAGDAVAGVTGEVARLIHTPSGNILIGGRGENRYSLDGLSGVNVVIDLGGDDVYDEGSTTLSRPVLIVMDLAGNDSYRGSKAAIQGAAVLGVSMLLDLEGDDVYQARDLAQGSCLAGVGILIDYAGRDVYMGVRRVQGVALGGLALLVDRGGSDRYHAAMWAQGFGGPLGFGLLDDIEGNDHYYSGGLYSDSYDETPGYEGWGQGVGAGLRQVANGGIGVILDGGGDDTYEYDYLSHGGGYWLGLGFARDFGGNDRRLAATSKTYRNGKRTERRFQRFGAGFGCHYALGFCFDDEGDDTYHGTIMGLGFAWDCAVGGLFDFGGNDRYEARGNSTQGNGAQAGLGILYDYNGDDVYFGYGQGQASTNITYHDPQQCGGNFSFVVDYGGTDKYGCRARNNSYNRRASSGGFLIDRPSRDESTTQAAENPSAATAKRRLRKATAGS